MTARRVRLFFGGAVALLAVLVLTIVSTAAAQTPTPPGDFSLQVTPSPLVTTVKPGEPTVLELKVRNGGTTPEELKIEPRDFEFDSDSGKITIDDTSSTVVSQWIKFSAPSFTLKPGEWYTQKVTIQVPKEAGFSYAFTLIVSRKSNPQPVSGGRLIKGSLAVFTLVNVDKPGATRKLEITSFTTDKKLYEYLPATLKVTFKNTGNSIVQPYGNIFLQRGADDSSPITTLKVNDAKAYILPGTTRTVEAEWDKGFPVYRSTTGQDGTVHRTLGWDWNHAADFRIGKYTAKLVAVYNDGSRDMPIDKVVSFWVVPWKAILLLIVTLVVLWLFGRWRSRRRTDKAVRRALEAQKQAQKQLEPADRS